MKREFSFYEFVGILAPGAVLLLIAKCSFSYFVGGVTASSTSLGSFGIFVIAAYVMGHLIQSVGNIIEWIWWRPQGGMPSEWVIKKDKCDYLGKGQMDAFPSQISRILKMPEQSSLYEYDSKEWRALTRQIYAAVRQANAAERVDIFNGNYGLFRGIAAAILAGSIIIISKHGFTQTHTLAVLATVLLMALARMHRFGKHYAKELFVQFLQL